ncbi:MAG: NEW3 domain-containing protein [Anaerolineae bacterium]|nr:NEW3 domain-containing protein [Anaerolineae bacterium]
MKRLLLTLLFSALVISLPASVSAQSPNVVLWTAYPTVVQDKGLSVSFDLELSNKTNTWQDIELKVEGPANWETTFRKSGYTVRRVMVEPDKSLSFELQVKPPENVTAGEYTFTVKATNQDRVQLRDLKLVVVVREKTGKGGLKFTTDYPSVRGQPGNTFNFRFDLANQADNERTVNFEATSPKDWEIVFRPGYESRQISSLPLKGGASQTINVDITAPRRVEAGDYKFVVRAIADNDRVEVPLTITIVGTPSLSLNTATGQLNTRVSVDSPSKMTLVLRNTGTAPLQNVTFSSFKPDGWEVTFDPDKLDTLAVGETKEVNATIKPSNRALAGDYMVTISASGNQASESKEIRVTVETPTTWGLAAVGAIALVVLGLAFVFARFSRR